MLKSKQNDDCMRIAVDDIDQFEHVEGTLKFYIHYQKRANQTITDGASQSLASKVSVGGIGALLILSANCCCAAHHNSHNVICGTRA